MKRLILVIGFGVLVAGSAKGSDKNAGTSVAPFLKVGVSARSAGMGGVSVAVGGGVDNLYANPASLANINSKEAMFMRHQWLEEVNFNYLAGILPLSHQGLGVSVNLIGTGDMKRTTYSNPDGDGTFETGGMVVAGGYGKKVSPQIQAGASLKYISQKIDDKTGTGIGMDIGTLYQMKDDFAVGAVVQNIGISKIKFIEKEEKLPLIIKAGCGYKIKNTTIGIDISKPNDNSIQFNLGGQYQIHPMFAIRAGYNSSIDEGPGITAGFGLSFQNLTFDGAWLPTGKFDPTFHISASMKF